MQSNRVLLYLSSRGRHSTAKTCFVLFNLFRWGRKPTVTLSFASDAVGLPRGPNVRLHHAVLVILPKYSSLGISGCRRKFTVSHTWPLVGHCLRPWEVVKDRANCKFITISQLTVGFRETEVSRLGSVHVKLQTLAPSWESRWNEFRVSCKVPPTNRYVMDDFL